MLRMLILYTLCRVRLGYRLWRAAAHRCLRPVPMPSTLRRHLGGAVALVPYLWVVWGFTGAFDFTWRAEVIAGAITVGMLLIAHRTETTHAPW